MRGCCGEGEVTVTFYFGDGGLFGLGEVALALEVPILPNFVLGAEAELSFFGEAKLALKWKAEI